MFYPKDIHEFARVDHNRVRDVNLHS